MGTIATERLALHPVNLDLARAALRDRAELARLLGARVPADWPGADFAGWLPGFAWQLEREPWRGEWTRLAVRTADRVLIGDMGFHGPPDDGGRVELGYSIVPAYRRQGYASEGARALVAWALGRPEVRRVVARCAPDNIASIRILEGAGLRRVAEAGGMLHWELRRDE